MSDPRGVPFLVSNPQLSPYLGTGRCQGQKLNEDHVGLQPQAGLFGARVQATGPPHTSSRTMGTQATESSGWSQGPVEPGGTRGDTCHAEGDSSPRDPRVGL